MEKDWPPLEKCPQFKYGVIGHYLRKFKWEEQLDADCNYGNDCYYDEENMDCNRKKKIKIRYGYGCKVKFDGNVLKKFLRQVRESRGYDVDCDPSPFLESPFMFFPQSELEEDEILQKQLDTAKVLLLQHIQSKTGKPYQFEQVVKFVYSSNRHFLITFTAKEAVPESALETFLATVSTTQLNNFRVLECFFKPDHPAPTV